MRALVRTGLMDSEPEAAFDRFTRLAARVLDVPVTLISLVQTRRQFFKSGVGTALREIPLSHSLCEQVVVTAAPVVVSDARMDPRTSGGPAVTELKVLAYLGVPLTTAGGHTLGALCAIDHVPRVWTADDLAVLEDLAGGVLSELELRATNAQLSEQRAWLAETSERLALTLEHAPIGMALVALDGRWLQVNRALCALTGYPEAELLGISFQDITHPDDLDADVQNLARLAAGEIPSYQSEKRYIRRDGSTVWVRLSVSLVRGAQGEPRHLISQVEDISKRKAAEHELRSARERSRTIIGAMREGYALTVQGEIVEVNDALCAMTGFDRDELIGARTPFPFWPPELRERNAALRDAVAAQNGGTFEIPLMRKNGSRFDAEVTAQAARNPDGTLLGFVNTLRDISAAKRQRTKLERERRALREAQHLARVGSWDYDVVNGRPGRWSVELWRMLGLTPRPTAPPVSEFIAMVAPDDRERVARRISQAFAAPESFLEEFGMIAGDGRELRVAFRAEISSGPDGRPTSAYGTIQDITDRANREAEEIAVREVAQLVAQAAGPAAVFDQVARQLCRLFKCHSGVVARFDEDRRRAVFVNARTPEGASLAGTELDLDGMSAPALVYRTNAPSRTGGAPTTGHTHSFAPVVAQITDAAAAPITVAGRLWGCLAAGFSDRLAPAGVEERLARFADLVAMAIANAEAWEALEREAATDSLTGLANHRTFQERLESEVTRARRYGRDLSLALLDFDYFKHVNDTHGHQAGDRVLVELARRLEAHVREGELIARIGGEEFAWLMPEADGEAGYRAADRIRRAIAEEPFDLVGPLTISVGVCAMESGTDGEDLIRFADRALYWAKDSGRNTTFLYTQEAHALLTRGQAVAERHHALSSVRALARAIHSSGPSTDEHAERVASLAQRLALELGWSAERARRLYACGLLHDAGRVGVSDDVLFGVDALTPDDRELVKQHALLSARIAAEVLDEEQVAWVRGHHECWNGTGGPDGLTGDEIPDGAQILAMADAWDVMTMGTGHRQPSPAPEALADCQAQAGRLFAPAAVAALVAVRRPS